MKPPREARPARSRARSASHGISHARTRLLLSKTWDGEVTERELRLLTAHLKECPECAAEAERMHRLLTCLDRCLKPRRRGGSGR